MKRAIFLVLAAAIVVVGIYSVKEWMPIMAIAGNSMEPELNMGDAVLIGRTAAPEVQMGDVIVFKVHPLIQENYRYPAVVTHRVIELTSFQGGLAFKTKGDNTGEDPFVVPASDLRGEVKGRLPYLGYVLLFLQSRQGMAFATIALVLLALELYIPELGRGRQHLQMGVFAPLLEQNQELAQRQEQASQMSSQALEQFATAMREYAQHLASHTEAIKALASASQELREAIREQNRMFSSWRGIAREAGDIEKDKQDRVQGGDEAETDAPSEGSDGDVDADQGQQ